MYRRTCLRERQIQGIEGGMSGEGTTAADGLLEAGHDCGWKAQTGGVIVDAASAYQNEDHSALSTPWILSFHLGQDRVLTLGDGNSIAQRQIVDGTTFAERARLPPPGHVHVNMMVSQCTIPALRKMAVPQAILDAVDELPQYPALVAGRMRAGDVLRLTGDVGDVLEAAGTMPVPDGTDLVESAGRMSMPEGTGLAEYVASLEGLSRVALAVECEHASIDVAAVVRGVSDPRSAHARADCGWLRDTTIAG
jgi:hypothetical protein